MTMKKSSHIERRVSSRYQPKPWPHKANAARVDSIGYAMDAVSALKIAKRQLEALRNAIRRRDTTLSLLELSRLQVALTEMDAPLLQIINLLENVPANTDDEGDHDE